MIVGASYNVFNGEEHLVQSLKVMRKCVEYINIVVQFSSNYGEMCSEGLCDALNEAECSGLYDSIIFYRPDVTILPVHNELRKRNLGLDRCRKNGVSHFLTMDCDEYYVPEEFKSARDIIEVEGYNSSSVATFLHVKRPIYRSRQPDTTCCSFLTKVESGTDIEFDVPYPVPVDPTRRLLSREGPHIHFDIDTISMRHMNLVRRDLASKLRNSPSAWNQDFMRLVSEAYTAWKPGMQLNFPNKPPMDIIEVEDLFDIDQNFSDMV
ncbi:hypothetical protein [Asticcacaulis excentricus]|uniref:Glycosyltransferase 2-like domain-containing protein n=1 Tax=Asticcacaulis excentricus (strain ATCC 15261 / DSM 4724 / KCTC 12464 / NCIMB 9791 / VKM B-1370 / CB 48) TaxID=573065 RepID=E8RMP8_ASTEC|nr:hypothetical protein [Asticcacaulis excentricus]ADU13929.1 hypothetical protein Astex_2274 [Asticcacaulis excentricus CB 48]